MPLVRYEIRNEQSLANPQLYRTASKDDPEGLLEGVAMAALVGIVRQLGDLAEFAAEIFRDLHEEVMATASRGHELFARVQQLEAEMPAVEKALLSETNQLRFAYTPGAEWHASIRNDQNHCTQGDLPKFIRNSYEGCRGPPRLFLLDKFDIGGAGACLKRYTDPSFFRTEWASSELMKAERAQRDKKARREKKGRRRRNVDVKESIPVDQLHMRYTPEYSRELTPPDQLQPRMWQLPLAEKSDELSSALESMNFNPSLGFVSRQTEIPDTSEDLARASNGIPGPKVDEHMDLVQGLPVLPRRSISSQSESIYRISEEEERSMRKDDGGMSSRWEEVDYSEFVKDEDPVESQHQGANDENDGGSDGEQFVDALATMESEADSDSEPAGKQDTDSYRVSHPKEGGVSPLRNEIPSTEAPTEEENLWSELPPQVLVSSELPGHARRFSDRIPDEQDMRKITASPMRVHARGRSAESVSSLASSSSASSVRSTRNYKMGQKFDGALQEFSTSHLDQPSAMPRRVGDEESAESPRVSVSSGSGGVKVSKMVADIEKRTAEQIRDDEHEVERLREEEYEKERLRLEEHQKALREEEEYEKERRRAEEYQRQLWEDEQDKGVLQEEEHLKELKLQSEEHRKEHEDFSNASISGDAIVDSVKQPAIYESKTEGSGLRNGRSLSVEKLNPQGTYVADKTAKVFARGRNSPSPAHPTKSEKKLSWAPLSRHHSPSPPRIEVEISSPPSSHMSLESDSPPDSPIFSAFQSSMSPIRTSRNILSSPDSQRPGFPARSTFSSELLSPGSPTSVPILAFSPTSGPNSPPLPPLEWPGMNFSDYSTSPSSSPKTAETESASIQPKKPEESHFLIRPQKSEVKSPSSPPKEPEATFHEVPALRSSTSQMSQKTASRPLHLDIPEDSESPLALEEPNSSPVVSPASSLEDYSSSTPSTYLSDRTSSMTSSSEPSQKLSPLRSSAFSRDSADQLTLEEDVYEGRTLSGPQEVATGNESMPSRPEDSDDGSPSPSLELHSEIPDEAHTIAQTKSPVGQVSPLLQPSSRPSPPPPPPPPLPPRVAVSASESVSSHSSLPFKRRDASPPASNTKLSRELPPLPFKGAHEPFQSRIPQPPASKNTFESRSAPSAVLSSDPSLLSSLPKPSLDFRVSNSKQVGALQDALPPSRTLHNLPAPTPPSKTQGDFLPPPIPPRNLHELPPPPPPFRKLHELAPPPLPASKRGAGADVQDALLDAITSHDRSMLKKVKTMPNPSVTKGVDDRSHLLEQIRAQSFNLRHTVVEKPEAPLPRPATSINVAAILEKANAIRQAFAGSDEDDEEEDDWSDS